MSIIRWEPFDEMMSLRESMDRLFEDFFTRRPRAVAPLVWQPATEVFETDSEVVVKAEHERREGTQLLPARVALRRVSAYHPAADRGEERGDEGLVPPRHSRGEGSEGRAGKAEDRQGRGRRITRGEISHG